MTRSALLLFAAITVASGVDCTTSDGTAAADDANNDGTCDCGVAWSDGTTVVKCADTTTFCFKSDNGYGECVASGDVDTCKDSAGADALDGSKAANIGCKCGNKACITGEYCTSTTPICQLPDCTNTNASAPTGVTGCKCGSTNCDVAKNHCDSERSVCFEDIAYAVCPFKNAKDGNLDHLCSCSTTKVCQSDEHCKVLTDGTTTCESNEVQACAKTNGLKLDGTSPAAEVPCACGDDKLIVTANTSGCNANGTEEATSAVAVCADTTGKAASANGCACGYDENCTTAEPFCKATSNAGVCSDTSILKDCAETTTPSATNGSAKVTEECLCGNNTAICAANTDYCDVSATADNKRCSTTPSTTDICGETAVVAGTSCLCGKTQTCSTADEFCHDSAGAGLCGKKCAVDPWNAIATGGACVCPGNSAECPVGGYCIEKTAAAGNTPAVNICIGADEGKIYTALKTAAVSSAETAATAAEKAKCNEASDKTCEEGDFCKDKSSGAECVGQFVATMGAAMYSL